MLSSFIFMMEELNWGLNLLYFNYDILLENDVNQLGIHFLLYDWIGFLTVEYLIFKLLVLIYLIILPIILSYRNNQYIYLITFIPLAMSIYLAGIRSFFIEIKPNNIFMTCSSSSGAELAEFQFSLTICFICLYFFQNQKNNIIKNK